MPNNLRLAVALLLTVLALGASNMRAEARGSGSMQAASHWED